MKLKHGIPIVLNGPPRCQHKQHWLEVTTTHNPKFDSYSAHNKTRLLNLVFDDLFDNLGNGSIDQLDVGHRRIVATTTSAFKDS